MTYNNENNICAILDVEFCKCNNAHIAHHFQQILVCVTHDQYLKKPFPDTYMSHMLRAKFY